MVAAMRLAFYNVLLVFFLISCGGKSDSMSNEEKISGKDSKTWEATRELNSEGDKEKLTRAEKKETITFSRNGTVKMSNNDQVMSGTWSFMDNTLSLQFTGTNVTESFTVLELQDDKMRLKAVDGSQLNLEPK
jgi:hypothetical protein